MSQKDMMQQLMFAQQFGGRISLPSGSSYRSMELDRRARLRSDVGTGVRFVTKIVAAIQGSPQLVIQDNNTASPPATTDDLVAAVQGLSSQIAATANRTKYQEVLFEGLSWIGEKLVDWFGPKDADIERTAQWLDDLRHQGSLTAQANAAAQGANYGASSALGAPPPPLPPMGGRPMLPPPGYPQQQVVPGYGGGFPQQQPAYSGMRPGGFAPPAPVARRQGLEYSPEFGITFF